MQTSKDFEKPKQAEKKGSLSQIIEGIDKGIEILGKASKAINGLADLATKIKPLIEMFSGQAQTIFQMTDKEITEREEAKRRLNR